jgi:cold-inducible RNA-binding protein
MNKNLYVGNLAFSVTDDELRQLFGSVGTVVSAKVIVDRYSNRSRGFGFVEMSTEAEAEEAINQLNGQEVAGRQITVAEARPPRRDRDRGPRRRDRW